MRKSKYCEGAKRAVKGFFLLLSHKKKEKLTKTSLKLNNICDYVLCNAKVAMKKFLNC